MIENHLSIDYDIPELTGVGTGVIDIYSKDTKKPCFKVYLADSGSYVRFREDGSPIPSSGWDNPHSDQIAWYIKNSADKIPHLWIQHIIVISEITKNNFARKEVFISLLVRDGQIIQLLDYGSRNYIVVFRKNLLKA